MLIEFLFKNYRSFRDKASLSLEAAGLGVLKNSLFEYGELKLLPGVAIYGKNGGGKSNVIRAFWLAVQFIKNAQRTQHENAEIPVVPFSLDDYSCDQPTEFEFTYIFDGIKYLYGFAATKEKVVSEYLYHAPKGQKALVFKRDGQEFKFSEDKAKRTLISKTIAQNQLFFSVACTMNDPACINAMRWFRECIFFSRDYSDVPQQLVEHYEDKNLLRAMSDYAVTADVGIEEMRFEVNSREVTDDMPDIDDLPEGMIAALKQFAHALSESLGGSEAHLRTAQVTAKARHMGTNRFGDRKYYEIDLSDESDGTRRLMALAPAIETALRTGGVLLVDEIERELHPALVNFIVSRFQNKKTNPNGAQIIFTTHNTELLNLEYLRKDQIYLVDKKANDGASELYSISDFSTRTTDNIRKGYLLGKYGAVPNIDIEEVE